MKKMILSAAAVLFVVSASIAQTDKAAAPAAATTVSNADGAAIKFEKDEYNFGTIKQGDKVEYTFMFTNTGKEPLIISEAHGSCGCTVPEWPKQPIKKGEKGEVKVNFN